MIMILSANHACLDAIAMLELHKLSMPLNYLYPTEQHMGHIHSPIRLLRRSDLAIKPSVNFQCSTGRWHQANGVHTPPVLYCTCRLDATDSF